jgi:plastocyanin domain-containing protein
MSKTVSIILILGLVIAFSIIFSSGPNSTGSAGGVVVKDGVQYITIGAKGGYYPRITEAKAGLPTKLIVKTDGTYDCSASLVIRSVGFQKILPQTGETEIDVGIKKAGETIQGVCGMGMYSFEVNFQS